MNEVFQGMKGTLFQVFSALSVNLMAVTDGMSVGWTAPMIPYFLSNNTHIAMSRTQADWLETSLLLGAVSGLPITMYVVDKIGRRKSLMLSTTVLILCWTLLALATEVEYLYIARFFKGLGLNMAFIAAPMYVGEISHKNIRGFLTSTIFVLMLIGVLIMYSVGPFVPYHTPSVIAGGLLLLELMVLCFLPESPYYLVTKRRLEEARKSLLRFRNSAEDLDGELEEIANCVEREQAEKKSSLKDLFLVKSHRKAMTIMFVLNSAQLLSSFEVILMNLHEILDSAGSIYIQPSLSAIIFAAVMVTASIAASLTIDSFGRKALLMVSSVLTGLCLLALALFFNLKHLGYDVISASWLPTVAVMAYAAVFKFGLGMVPIVLTAEIFATKIKALGMTIADGVYVVASIVALQIYLQLKEVFGVHVPFYVFSCCAFATCVYVALCVPETKGKTLEEIQVVLRGRGSSSSGETASCRDSIGD